MGHRAVGDFAIVVFLRLCAVANSRRVFKHEVWRGESSAGRFDVYFVGDVSESWSRG